MTTEVAKPEGGHAGPFRGGQANRRTGGANQLLRMLGPGLVTGASDDDPSGIGTYSQVGAQFGYGLLWTMLISYSLMGGDSGDQRTHRARHGVRHCSESPQKLSQTSALCRTNRGSTGKRF
jgi:hypothetical protein